MPAVPPPETLRDDIYIPEHNSQSTILQSSLPSQRPLKRLLWRIKSQWKIVLVTSGVALNLILILSLFTINQSSISETRAEIGQIGEDHSDKAPTLKYLPIKDGSSSSSIRKLLLTLSSQQSQINALKSALKESTVRLEKMQTSLSSTVNSQDSLFQSLVIESNITLCTDKDKLVAPVDGVYRVHFKANVHGDTYISRKMFYIKKNGKALDNGGTIRIKYNGMKNKTVDCAPAMPRRKSCFAMSEILLVQLDKADSLQVVDEFTSSRGGTVYGLELCMRVSDYSAVPGGGDSLVITH